MKRPRGRPRKPLKQQRLNVISTRITCDVWQKIRHVAKRRDLNVTQILREAILEYVGKYIEDKVA